VQFVEKDKAIVAWTAGFKKDDNFLWCPKGEQFSSDLKVSGEGEKCVKIQIQASESSAFKDGDLVLASCAEKQIYACEVYIFILLLRLVKL